MTTDEITMATQSVTTTFNRKAMDTSIELSSNEKLKTAILENAKAVYGPHGCYCDFAVITLRAPPNRRDSVVPDPKGTEVADPTLISPKTTNTKPTGPESTGRESTGPESTRTNCEEYMPYRAKLLGYIESEGRAWVMLQSSTPKSVLSDALAGLLQTLQWMLAEIFTDDPMGTVYMARCGRDVPHFPIYGSTGKILPGLGLG